MGSCDGGLPAARSRDWSSLRERRAPGNSKEKRARRREEYGCRGQGEAAAAGPGGGQLRCAAREGQASPCEARGWPGGSRWCGARPEGAGWAPQGSVLSICRRGWRPLPRAPQETSCLGVQRPQAGVRESTRRRGVRRFPFPLAKELDAVFTSKRLVRGFRIFF